MPKRVRPKTRTGMTMPGSWRLPAARGKNPLAVFVEYGLHGSSAAGPIARDMLKAYFGVDDRGKIVESTVPAAPDKEYDELLDNLGD